MQRIGKNIFSLGASRITSGLILFFVYIRLVTYLGPEDFGRFSLVLAFYTMFLLFIDLGMSRYVIKKVSQDPKLAEQYLGNFLILQFFLSALVFLVFILLPYVLGYDKLVTDSMWLAGVGLFLAAVALPFAAILQAVQKIHLVALVYFFHSLITASWFVFVMLSGEGLVFLFWIYIIVAVVDLLIYWVVTKKIAVLRLNFDKGLIKRMFIFGLPFAFISGFEILIQKFDVVIQKFFLPFFEVGLYSSAYRFLDFLTFIPAVVAISLFPYFAEKKDLNDQESLSTINNLNRYMWTLALPLGIFSTILAKDIILTLFDERYLGSVLPFQILIWATALTLVYAVPNVMMIVKHTKRTLFFLLGVVIFNIALNFLLVPVYGIVASAWITVASYIITAALYIYHTKQAVSYTIFSFAGWPILASVISGAFLWQMSGINFILSGVIASVVYFTILFAVKYLKKEDWQLLKLIFSRSR